MSWVCSNCSSANLDDSTSCMVCGISRPAVSARSKKRASERKTAVKSTTEREPVEGVIVFSDFSFVVESTKMSWRSFSRFVSNVVKKIKSVDWKGIGSKIRGKSKSEADKAEPKATLSGSKRADGADKTFKETKRTPPEAACDFASPWPEHDIVFDIEVIKSKGFVRSERTELSGIKGYTFYKEGASSQFIKMEMLLIQRMASKA